MIPLLALGVASSAQATVITFTGGEVIHNEYQRFVSIDPVSNIPTFEVIPAGSGATNNNQLFASVQTYTESGFVFKYVGGTGGSIGNYYSVGNDVIHAHWGVSEMTGIEIYKADGSSFDFNFFVLTSNTLRPGGSPTGFEDVHIHGWYNGAQVGADVIAPSEAWGFPATEVYFGSNFDMVDKVTITSTHTSFSCFGMDSFYIDEQAPEPGALTVPEPSGVSLLALGAGAFVLRRKRRGAD